MNIEYGIEREVVDSKLLDLVFVVFSRDDWESIIEMVSKGDIIIFGFINI